MSDPLYWLYPYQAKRLKQPKQGRVFKLRNKQSAMRDARYILSRLRRECTRLDWEEKTPYVVRALRIICPWIFEELLLHCFEDLQMKVKRGCYTHDGGIDGTVWDDRGEKMLIQAKRYSGEIDPHHLLDFAEVVLETEAASGLFIHTGITCEMSRRIDQELNEIEILDGCDLRRLVLQ